MAPSARPNSQRTIRRLDRPRLGRCRHLGAVDRLSSLALMSNIVNMSTATKNRLKQRDRGPGGKRTRSERTNNLPVDDDPQTEIEAELASSGRSDVVPKEGLVGAHWVRRQPTGELERSQRS